MALWFGPPPYNDYLFDDPWIRVERNCFICGIAPTTSGVWWNAFEVPFGRMLAACPDCIRVYKLYDLFDREQLETFSYEP